MDFSLKKDSESFSNQFSFPAAEYKKKRLSFIIKKRKWNQGIFFESILFFGFQPQVSAEKKEKINFDTACSCCGVVHPYRGSL